MLYNFQNFLENKTKDTNMRSLDQIDCNFKTLQKKAKFLKFITLVTERLKKNIFYQRKVQE